MIVPEAVRTPPVTTPRLPSASMAPPVVREAVESLPLGRVKCDFMRLETFRDICQQWLTIPHVQFHHVVTLNPEMVMQAEDNQAFREAVGRADVRVPDGAGLIWAQWYIRSQFWSLVPSLLAFSFRAVERITGVETVWLLARLCARYQLPLYLLGGTPAQVERTASLLHQRLPTLPVVTAPDYAFDMSGPISVLEHIRAHRPAVLLVAYGALKQIPWIEHHRHHLPSVRVAVGVGGAFAILSEDTPRAPHILRQLNLEWLWRLLLEPARLPRIWRATVLFPLLVRRQKMSHPPVFTAPSTSSIKNV